MAVRATRQRRRPPLLAAKVGLSRAVGRLSRRAGRGGTSLPGKLLLRLEPHAVGRLASELPSGCAVISATNGKTTTAAMATAILELGQMRIVGNRSGANMAGGIAAALAEQRSGADFGLFEVDEFWLGALTAELRPRVLLLANLFRDQLDRYGEMETIAERWQRITAALPGTALVLNADDPTVADLGRDRSGDGAPLYFGIDDPGVGLTELSHASDAKHCRRCGAPYRYDAVLLGHLGHYHCDACGAARPVPTVRATEVRLDGLRGSRVTVEIAGARLDVTIPLPGLYNVYNALGAAALAHSLGVPPEQIAAGLSASAPAFGRAEVVAVGGVEVLLMLVKNPTGANEVLRTLALEPGEHRLLAVLNDRIADGRDVSWIWDADVEGIAGHVGEVVCSGTRASEMALRFRYAGVPAERIVVEPALGDALDRLLNGGGGADATGRVVALPTYTAMLELRELLHRRGALERAFS